MACVFAMLGEYIRMVANGCKTHRASYQLTFHIYIFPASDLYVRYVRVEYVNIYSIQTGIVKIVAHQALQFSTRQNTRATQPQICNPLSPLAITVNFQTPISQFETLEMRACVGAAPTNPALLRA